MTDDPIAANNLFVYDARQESHYWASYSEDLLTAERVVLASIEAEISGRPLLDAGVGGGRTTPHLLRISDDYLGFDFSPAMVEACKARFPGIRFACCDAREMSVLGSDHYALVLFSFNGIDCVGHEDRLKVYAQVREALVADGLFFFSAHNLRDREERRARPWHLSGLQLPGNGNSWLDFARSAYHWLGRNVSYLRLRGQQVHGDEHAVLLARGQRFRALTYCIDPSEQVRQLAANGFRDIRVFDKAGVERSHADPFFADHPHPVHYLARKA